MEQVDQRIETIKAELQQTESIYECERLQERITRLASGIAIIRVGAPTEIEMIEKKHRIEDALEAVRSAQQEGIVAGGGVALLRAAEGGVEATENEEQALGFKIIMKAIEEPVRQMALNSGESPDIIVSMVKSEHTNYGYDFLGRKMIDMVKSGIIDPAKVTRCALQNAASAAGTLITTNYAIVQN
jgi:chaperonin GroEL